MQLHPVYNLHVHLHHSGNLTLVQEARQASPRPLQLLVTWSFFGLTSLWHNSAHALRASAVWVCMPCRLHD